MFSHCHYREVDLAMLRTDSVVLLTRVGTAGHAPRYAGGGAVGQRKHPSSSVLPRQLTGLPWRVLLTRGLSTVATPRRGRSGDAAR
jgi:hypothetical protein